VEKNIRGNIFFLPETRRACARKYLSSVRQWSPNVKDEKNCAVFA